MFLFLAIIPITIQYTREFTHSIVLQRFFIFAIFKRFKCQICIIRQFTLISSPILHFTISTFCTIHCQFLYFTRQFWFICIIPWEFIIFILRRIYGRLKSCLLLDKWFYAWLFCDFWWNYNSFYLILSKCSFIVILILLRS